MEITHIKKTSSAVQLKADFFPITVLQITSGDLTTIEQEIDKAIAKAPHYFTHTPVIIDLNASTEKDSISLENLCNILKNKKIIPVGIRGLAAGAEDQAHQAGLALFKNTPPPESSRSPKKVERQSRLMTKPIRGGTRVYAKNGDLIVLAGVNSGGECIADGHIHVYGPLRGRAIAGANGDTEARIFCKSLEAELVAIAGRYLVNEEFQIPADNHTMLQIFLDDEGKLKIESV